MSPRGEPLRLKALGAPFCMKSAGAAEAWGLFRPLTLVTPGALPFLNPHCVTYIYTCLFYWPHGFITHTNTACLGNSEMGASMCSQALKRTTILEIWPQRPIYFAATITIAIHHSEGGSMSVGGVGGTFQGGAAFSWGWHYPWGMVFSMGGWCFHFPWQWRFSWGGV